MQRLFAKILTIDSLNEDVQRRGRVLVILTLLIELITLAAIPLVLFNTQARDSVIVVVLGVVIYAVVLMVTRRGWVTAGGLLLIGTISSLTLLTMIGNGNPSITTAQFLILPVLVSSLVLPFKQIWVVFVIVVAGLLGVMYGAHAEKMANPEVQTGIFAAVFLLSIVAALGFLGAWVTQSTFTLARIARRNAEDTATALETTNAALDQRVSERTAELEMALREVEHHSRQQAQLLAENEAQRTSLRELSVPVLPVSASTLVMPLIGALDTERLNDLQQQALTAIERTGARRMLLDITGVPVVDTQVAHGLIQVVEAARLLGAQVVLVGMRPEVAQAVVGLGINLATMRSYTDLQSALA